MNYRLVAKNLGYMLLLIATAMSTCLLLGYLLPAGPGHNSAKALAGWKISIAITGTSSIAMILFGRHPPRGFILRRDAIGIVGIGWIVCSIYASLPYLFCEPELPFGHALFEGVSGLTTTGATVITDLSRLPQTVLLWRSLTEWIGGMGILAMFVLILSSLGASGKSLFQTESSAHAREITGTTLKQTVRSLWMLYISLTLVCGLGLWIFGMTPFQAVNHMMTTVATGGFGTENDSISGFSVPLRIWMMIFMILGAVSFPLFLALLRKNRDWSVLRKHEETWTFAGILIAVIAAMITTRAVTQNFESTWAIEAVDTMFNVVSIATTSGFAVGDYDHYPLAGKGLILMLMVIGGCAGSTAGGLKVSRLILWWKIVRAEIRRAYRPNEVVGLRLNGRSVPEGTRGQLFIILTTATAAAAISSFFLIAFEPGKSVDDCVSAVVACLLNIGPAFGEFGPTDNYSTLSNPGMAILSFLMLLGRLEFVAVLVLFSKQLWRRY